MRSISTPTRRVVIVGAGVVGCAVADELTARGLTAVTLLDQGPLPRTGGSSSHAPGLVFRASHSKATSELADYTARKLGELRGRDGLPCFFPVGGLEVATTPERLADLHRRHGWLSSWGLRGAVLDAAATAALHPLLDPDVLLGGLHTPGDGLARAVEACAAQAARAAERGATLLGEHRVLEVLTGSDGAVRGVRTDHGEIACDTVVCCAGFWGPSVAGLVDLVLPMQPLAHQYATTTPVPALAALPPLDLRALAEAAAPVRALAGVGGRDGIDRAAPSALDGVRPILRHQGAALYVREHGERIGIGSYGHAPMPVAQGAIATEPISADGTRMPSIQPFTPEDFAPCWEDARRLLPGLEEAEVEEGMNGIFSFTPDGAPLIGEHGGVPGFWVAEAVWVTHSAGVGRAVAQLLVDGRSEVALHEADLHRFTAVQQAPGFIAERGAQGFREVYDAVHPLDPPAVARGLRTSPWHDRQEALGAVFLEHGGWERPQWYAVNADRLDGIAAPPRDAWSSRWFSEIALAEARATREAVALYDMTSLTRLEVSGPGALAFLQHQCTNDLDRPAGSVRYALLLDGAGGIAGDVTVARLAHDRFLVGAGGPLDVERLRRALPADGSVVLRDLTPGTCGVGLWGPRARDVLQPLTPADVSHAAMGYFKAVETTVAGIPVTALRVSYVGELGWELYCAADGGRRLWDALMAAGEPHGILAAGRAAFDALRIERGYRAWGRDMSAEHDPDEAGVGFAVATGDAKGDFVGRAALLALRDGRAGPRRRLVPLVLDDVGTVPLGAEPVDVGDGDRDGRRSTAHDGPADGYVTSAAYAPTLGRTVAYAWLPAEHAQVGTRATVRSFAERLGATVAAEPLVDPGMERLRR